MHTSNIYSQFLSAYTQSSHQVPEAIKRNPWARKAVIVIGIKLLRYSCHLLFIYYYYIGNNGRQQEKRTKLHLVIATHIRKKSAEALSE